MKLTDLERVNQLSHNLKVMKSFLGKIDFEIFMSAERQDAVSIITDTRFIESVKQLLTASISYLEVDLRALGVEV